MSIRQEIERAAMRILKSRKKVKLWFLLQNPVLDWMSPNDWIKLRRGKKLLSMVRDYRK